MVSPGPFLFHAITLVGNWATPPSVGTETTVYNSTVHQSSTTGDQLSYTFEGTGLTVYGTIDAPGINGSPGPAFGIDGQTSTGFSFKSIVGRDQNGISSLPLYTSRNLTKGTHTLTISSGTPANTSTHLYIDFFTVDTGSDSASGNIIVDDRDTSIIYVGNWRDLDEPWAFELTAKGNPVDVAGGTATFRFNGTSIAIYGTTPSSSGVNTTASITFTIDGSPSAQLYSPQNSGVIQYNTLFHVAGLSNTQEHGIVMTSLGTNQWLLDYMVYTTRDSLIAGSGGGGSSITASETDADGGEPTVGSVAGGVLAGVIALVLITGIIFIHLRRRQRKPNEEFNDKSVTVGAESHFDPPLKLSPFTTPATRPHVFANPLPGTRCHFNGSSHPLANVARERVGRVLLDSTEYTSYLGTASRSSSLPRGMGQYSDGESPQVLIPTASSPGYGHQNLENPLYPRFEPPAGGEITSMYQNDSRQDHGQETGQPFGQKAQFHGHSAAPITPALTTRRGLRPPSSSVSLIEEDSGIRIPTKAPPVYTPD